MKIRLCCVMFVGFLFSGVCLAQRPAPALIYTSRSNEVSVDFLVPVKGPNLSSYGFGGQVAESHFFDEHCGVKLQADYLKTDYLHLRDDGVRIGPIIRLASKHAIQPYLEVLVGYAQVKASYLKPPTAFHGSGSILAGGGFDFPVMGGLYAKAGVDVQDDWAARTRSGRGLIGVAYRFGSDTRQRLK